MDIQHAAYCIARKFGRELNLIGSLAIYITTAIFPTRIYTYGDPVPNHQIYIR